MDNGNTDKLFLGRIDASLADSLIHNEVRPMSFSNQILPLQ